MSFKLTDIIPDSIKDKYMEDETIAQAIIPAKPSQPLIVNSLSSPSPSNFLPSLGQPTFPISPDVIAAKINTSNPILDDLRSKTSFEATPLGQQLQGFIDALSETGMTDDQKIRTALKLGHITPESVVSTLTGIQAVLGSERQKFDAQMSAATTSEVDGRQQKVAGLESQIAELESQLNAARQQKSTLTTEATEKAAKIASLRSDYSVAYDRRNTEIAQMITKYQISTGKS